MIIIIIVPANRANVIAIISNNIIYVAATNGLCKINLSEITRVYKMDSCSAAV